MPYDPNFPIDDTVAEAPLMRAQLNSIVDLIQAIPAGPPGPAITSYVVDAVNTLGPGESASVVVGFESPSVHLTFNIPRGATGDTGPQGGVFMNFVADQVQNLPAGSDATVSTLFDGTHFHFIFAIPRGDTGATGAPGEVTAAQLTSAIGGTSSVSNAVAELATPFADPDAEALRLKFNELILALRR